MANIFSVTRLTRRVMSGSWNSIHSVTVLGDLRTLFTIRPCADCYFITLSESKCLYKDLAVRAGYLGDYMVNVDTSRSNKDCRRPIRYGDVDDALFRVNIENVNLPEYVGNTDSYLNCMTDIMYKCATDSRRTAH